MTRTGLLAVAAMMIWPALAIADDSAFQKRDANGDGIVTYAEHAAIVTEDLRRMDSDNDGRITLAEYAADLGRDMPGASSQVLRAVAACMFKALGQKSAISTDDMRAFQDRVFKWLAGEDGQLTKTEAARTPPPDIVPTPVCH
ncbi:hypothetical protein ACERNI_09985 [Camelimonas sp. ID_303_24]